MFRSPRTQLTKVQIAISVQGRRTEANSYPPPCRNYLQPLYLSVTLYACAQRAGEVVCALTDWINHWYFYFRFHRFTSVNPLWDSVTGPFYYVAIYWCPSDRRPRDRIPQGITQVWQDFFQADTTGKCREIGQFRSSTCWKWNRCDDAHHDEIQQFKLNRAIAPSWVLLLHQVRQTFRPNVTSASKGFDTMPSQPSDVSAHRWSVRPIFWFSSKYISITNAHQVI